MPPITVETDNTLPVPNESQRDFSAEIAMAKNASMSYTDKALSAHRSYTETAMTEFAKLVDLKLRQSSGRIMRVQVDSMPVTTLPSSAHPLLGDALLWLRAAKAAKIHDGLWLWGPKGSGKSTLAVQAAKALNVPYYSLSCSAATPESQFIGRINAHDGSFAETSFIKAWRDGGLFSIEEAAGLDENVTGVIMNALANGVLITRHGEQVERSPNCYIVATDNTVGRGADSQYTARNRQDAAFLDRFIPLYVGYTDEIDRAVCPHDGLRKYLTEVREKLISLKSSESMAPRVMRRAWLGLSVGMTPEQVFSTITAGWSESAIEQCGITARKIGNAWNKEESKPDSEEIPF